MLLVTQPRLPANDCGSTDTLEHHLRPFVSETVWRELAYKQQANQWRDYGVAIGVRLVLPAQAAGGPWTFDLPHESPIRLARENVLRRIVDASITLIILVSRRSGVSPKRERYASTRYMGGGGEC